MPVRKVLHWWYITVVRWLILVVRGDWNQEARVLALFLSQTCCLAHGFATMYLRILICKI